MEQTLYQLIRENEKVGNFTHTEFNQSMLIESEQRLNVKIPIEYQEFLGLFGHGGLDGIEIIGIGKNKSLAFVEETEKYRRYGLPDNLIVIENCDEWLYCINAVNGKVEMWSRNSEKSIVAFEDFQGYLRDRINDALENM